MPLDPETSALLEAMGGIGLVPFEHHTPDGARKQYAVPTDEPGMTVADVSERTIPAGDAEIRIKILVPDEPAAAIVYFHGGGWVIGDIDSFTGLGHRIALATGCAVVLVDYRLAPEHRFPAAVDDAYLATEWVAANMSELFGRPLPIIVGGDSAGGTLAAVTARRARDRNGPRIAMQVLIYPATGAEFDGPSYVNPDNQLLLTRQGILWFWNHYVPDPALRGHPDASPLNAEDLAGLPPAVLLTAEYDVLRDEGEKYAARLVAAGVSVDFRRHQGQMHGFMPRYMLPGSARGLQQIASAVKARLRTVTERVERSG